ncbi:MAG: sugar phosphate isomerase/epimerase [Bacillota bacterium]|jgi:sugar phosphate isomerase/epimerase|nr:sugar phosphate isomerase/epimerase [Bacillota bacterium]
MRPKIMFSSRVFGNNTQAILDYAVAKGFDGVEWYHNSFRLRTNKKMRNAFFNTLDQYPKLHYTFHLPTVDVELAHAEPLIAQASLGYLKMYIEYLAPWLQSQDEPPVLTLHVGSNSIPVDELNWETALAHLRELGELARQRNANLLLENLKVGWTTDPKTHLAMANHAGLGITFDTGHAASNPLVRSGELDVVEYMDRLKDRIQHVHFYAYESIEKGGHIPPETWDEVAQTWRKVLSLPQVRSVVLELSTQRELEQTFHLLMENRDEW